MMNNKYILKSAVATMSLLVVACSDGDTTDGKVSSSASSTVVNGQADESNVSALALYTMDCGVIDISDLDSFSTIGDYKGVRDVFSDSCHLIRHPKGDLLWDVGLPEAMKADEPVVNGVYTITVKKTVTEQLAEINLTPDDIEYLSVSHNHFDHTGQPEAAGDALWLVHENEYQAMFGNEQTAAQFARFKDFKRKEFTGDYDVFGDGSVKILELPGHTPGHTALLVNLPESGPVMLSGDLFHRKESRELRRVPRFNTDEPQTHISMDKFDEMAKALGARVVIQHEPDDVNALPKFPKSLN